MTTTVADGVPDCWRRSFINYFQHGQLPIDLKKKADIRRRAPRFLYYHGHYWPTMVYHANFIHQPPEPLYPITAAWHFDAWGLDMVGHMPWSKEGYEYILAATDYFSKWVEAKLIMSWKQVADFIKSNIIYRYGVPKYILQKMAKPSIVG
ncbi:hypothetical protein LIER_34896 [Lithospermum erythrorhizon]|uniref:Integrase catalytic domain-containing protein n=1 Tax=Lithospermum erythrorhizon TaxID=34254 RepID=A0AAV3S0V7_LITER